MHNHAANSVHSPPPQQRCDDTSPCEDRRPHLALGVLPGRGWGWGSELQDVSRATTTTPTPAQRRQACAGCASLPACADPPHKGEGKDRVWRSSGDANDPYVIL